MSAVGATLPKLHFISGLPRSGSTLLAGILRQNPRFHAAMTGPVGSLFGALLNAMGPQNETALFLSEEQKRDPPAQPVRGLLPAAGGQGRRVRHQPRLVRALPAARAVPRRQGPAACATSPG